MAKIDLPNQAGSPSLSNLTGEYGEYTRIFNLIGRSTSGQESFVSTTSNQTYSTIDYPSEPTIYNKGLDGLLNLLTNVLRDSLWLAEDANAKLDKDGGELVTYTEDVIVTAFSGGVFQLDLDASRVWEISILSTTEITFQNVPPSGSTASWTVILHQSATGSAITFPSSVKWANDTIPDISTANETVILSFVSTDGGVTVYGSGATGFDV